MPPSASPMEQPRATASRRAARRCCCPCRAALSTSTPPAAAATAAILPTTLRRRQRQDFILSTSADIIFAGGAQTRRGWGSAAASAASPTRRAARASLFLLVALWWWAFVAATGWTIIAGAVSRWFFRSNAKRNFLGGAFMRALWFHLGSMAFGAAVVGAAACRGGPRDGHVPRRPCAADQPARVALRRLRVAARCVQRASGITCARTSSSR